MNAPATPAAVTAAALAGHYGPLPLASVIPSPTNPRKHFDDGPLKELAESIRTKGLLQPIVVRRKGEKFELIAGERRWRAHKIAGLQTIEARVLDLDDKAVLELQLIENLQREGLHPLEEADGYDKLVYTHKISVDALAERIGKSRSYVFARLKLRDLAGPARELYQAGKFGSEHALLLARIAVKDLQARAAKEITSGRYGSEGVMSFREAKDHIARNYMLRLVDAPFDTKDAKLVPGADACTACPKRTANQPELFADLKKDDLCTDPQCFAGKKEAAKLARIEAAKAAGQKVITGAEAKKVYPNQWGGPSGGLVTTEHTSHRLDYKSPRELLGKDMPKPVLVVNPHDGELVELVDEKEVLQVAKQKGLLKKRPADDSMAKHREQQKREDAKREAEASVRRAVWLRLREKIATAPSVHDWRIVAGELWRQAAEFGEHEDELRRLHGLDRPASLKIDDPDKLLAPLNAQQLAQVMFDCVLIQETGYYGALKNDLLLEAAKRHKVDVDAIRKELQAEAKAKAAPKKKAAKK